ncbi:HAD family hydrolase [bacterium]|nr:HAD family hydrolase [bacterium]
MSARVVVLDRDGTIVEDRHYIRNPDDIIFLPGAIEGLKQIQEKGYPLYLVSNQSGVGRGLITEKEFQAVHKRFLELCTQNGIAFEEIAYCFHAPEESCPCRKPAPGLAPREFHGQKILWSESFVAGDHEPDLGLAASLGAKPCLVKTGKGPITLQKPLPQGTQVFETILEFSDFLPRIKT